MTLGTMKYTKSFKIVQKMASLNHQSTNSLLKSGHLFSGRENDELILAVGTPCDRGRPVCLRQNS